ncbi:hypothetical protein N7524_011032 [Penicillium chrysogenum]|nr:hypothetical protein N7524_011032 [Penicillium chrysogenum]
MIRPSYYPFYLWNIGLEAEDRLHYIYLKTRSLERSQFVDIAKLLLISSNPKPPRKRKRPSKAEAQYYSIKQHKQLPKKLRFYRYPPPQLKYNYQLPENTTIPVPTLHSFVEEHPEQFFNSSFSNESTKSSRSSPVASYFSRSSSPYSSDPTTPRFKGFINPRILKPYTIDKNQGTQPYNQASIQPNPLHKHKIKNKLFGDVIRLQPPGQSLTIQPSPNPKIIIKQIQPLYSPLSFITSKENKKEDLHKESSSFISHGDGCPSTEPRVQNPSPTNQVQTLPRDRTQGKQQSTQHYLDHTDETKSRKKLNVRDKRKLYNFKSQKKTLRQIRPYFPDINTVSLRQA